MIDRYDAIYEKNYMSYQETGASRYLNEARKAEDIVDVCQQALTSADDHEAALHAQQIINQLAKMSDRIRREGCKPEEMKAVLDEIIDIAECSLGYKSHTWRRRNDSNNHRSTGTDRGSSRRHSSERCRAGLRADVGGQVMTEEVKNSIEAADSFMQTGQKFVGWLADSIDKSKGVQWLIMLTWISEQTAKLIIAGIHMMICAAKDNKARTAALMMIDERMPAMSEAFERIPQATLNACVRNEAPEAVTESVMKQMQDYYTRRYGSDDS